MKFTYRSNQVGATPMGSVLMDQLIEMNRKGQSIIVPNFSSEEDDFRLGSLLIEDVSRPFGFGQAEEPPF